MATVRVYVVTYRRPLTLRRALNSLRSQTCTDWICELHNDDPADLAPGKLVDEFRKTSRAGISHYMRVLRSSEISGPMIEFFGSVGVAGFFVYFAFFSKVKTTPADLIQFVGAIFLMYQPIKSIIRLHNQLEQAHAASEPVFALLATEVPPERRSTTLNLVYMPLYAAGIIGPTLGAGVAAVVGISGPFILGGAVFLAGAAAIALRRPPSSAAPITPGGAGS